MSKRINNVDNFNSAGPLASIRYWLIKMIAGKAIVILNASIDIEKSDSDLAVNVVDAPHGAFIENNTFYESLKVSQVNFNQIKGNEIR